MDLEIVGFVEALSELEQDSSMPKNVKLKLQTAIFVLKEDGKDLKIKANKALQELEEVSDDPNMPSYLKPQIWNIVSLLENI